MKGLIIALITFMGVRRNLTQILASTMIHYYSVRNLRLTESKEYKLLVLVASFLCNSTSLWLLDMEEIKFIIEDDIQRTHSERR